MRPKGITIRETNFYVGTVFVLDSSVVRTQAWKVKYSVPDRIIFHYNVHIVSFFSLLSFLLTFFFLPSFLSLSINYSPM